MKLADYLVTHPKKHLIFDFDDTIFRMGKWGQPAWKGMLDIVAAYDANLHQQFEDTPRSIYKLSNQAIMTYGNEVKEKVIAWINEFESALHDTEARNDELIDFIRSHHEQYSYAIWSQNSEAMIAHVLDKHDLLTYFSIIVGRESMDLAKPYTDGFHRIYDSINQQRKDYLMIWDSETDRQAAYNAGIDFFSIEKEEVDRQ